MRGKQQVADTDRVIHDDDHLLFNPRAARLAGVDLALPQPVSR